MRRLRHSLLARGVLLSPCCVLWLSACSGPKWVEVRPPIDRALAQEKPDAVRLTLVSDSIRVVGQPRIAGDTLSGLDTDRWVPTGAEIDGVPVREHPRLFIPLADIRRAEVRKGSSAVPALVIGVLAIGSLISLGVMCGDDSFMC